MENVPRCLSSFIDEGSEESHRYYLARRTILEMLRDRGYDVLDSEICLSLEGFRSAYGQKPNLDLLLISVPLLHEPSKEARVIFCGNQVLKLKVVEDIYTKNANNSQKLNKLILILENKITAQARQSLKRCRVKVEIFQITDLLVNITKHVLMPKHEVLSSGEKEELLKKYNVGDTQIPRMLETDAIARYYGLEKGQVVKITSRGDVTGSNVTCRCVV